jgi:hypothetical protein
MHEKFNEFGTVSGTYLRLVPHIQTEVSFIASSNSYHLLMNGISV